MPRQHVENTKEFCSENEAKRANKHANRRIIYLPPFWNKVYRALDFTCNEQQLTILNLIISLNPCLEYLIVEEGSNNQS